MLSVTKSIIHNPNKDEISFKSIFLVFHTAISYFVVRPIQSLVRLLFCESNERLTSAHLHKKEFVVVDDTPS